MGERAEAAIAHEQVVGLQPRVQEPHLRLLVRAQREGQQFDDQAGGGIEQAEDLGHRKAAAGLLPTGLAEGGLRGGRVGGDRAGAIHEHRPQPAPPRRHGRRAHGLRRVAQQRLQHGQRQAHAGPAVRRRFHRALGEQAQVRHGGVEVQDLQQEQVNGSHRPVAPFAPHMAGLVAGLPDRLLREKGLQIVLDPIEGACETGHPWPPVFW